MCLYIACNLGRCIPLWLAGSFLHAFSPLSTFLKLDNEHIIMLYNNNVSYSNYGILTSMNTRALKLTPNTQTRSIKKSSFPLDHWNCIWVSTILSYTHVLLPYVYKSVKRIKTVMYTSLDIKLTLVSAWVVRPPAASNSTDTVTNVTPWWIQRDFGNEHFGHFSQIDSCWNISIFLSKYKQ